MTAWSSSFSKHGRIFLRSLHQYQRTSFNPIHVTNQIRSSPSPLRTQACISIATTEHQLQSSHTWITMPKPPLRIAMLECDTPLPKTKERFGGYGGVFEFLLKRGARALNTPGLDPERGLEITKWPVEQDPGRYPRLEDIDAILITGSSMCISSPHDGRWSRLPGRDKRHGTSKRVWLT